MSLDQSQSPLIEVLRTLANRQESAFYAPGHKRGQGMAQPLKEWFGQAVFQADLPELPALDNLFTPTGVIKIAQKLAAEAFGAQFTWFLINGSTCGVIAAILATCRAGEKIILPRNVHQSAIAGLILSGAIPVFINPEYDPEWDLTYSIPTRSVEITLKQHPDAQAVFIVSPTYHGIGADVAAIAQITHCYGIPLLIDEAHGAHFTFHPNLPPSALASGADLVIQSTHKVLGAMTQASMLHLQGDYIDLQRITSALQLVQSTSPSYILLASLDAARQQMALYGEALLTETLNLAESARQQLSQIAQLSVLTYDKPQPGFHSLDTTRLTVNVSQLGLSGFEVDEILHQQFSVTAELPLLRHLTFIISIGNTSHDIEELVNAFQILSNQSKVKNNIPLVPLSPCPLVPVSPREAFFAATEIVDKVKAIGRISAELICPYPPGIPVLMPGEVITEEAIAYLKQVLALGGNITGCSDPTLLTFKVIC